jgi:ankyrin repeat protein
MTPLHLAAHLGYVEILDLLLSAGADLDSKTNIDMTALHFAAQGGMLQL